ncbi:hypothetical protein D027_2100B, partial [Vibrio parahaemolyticus 861]
FPSSLGRSPLRSQVTKDLDSLRQSVGRDNTRVYSLAAHHSATTTRQATSLTRLTFRIHFSL